MNEGDLCDGEGITVDVGVTREEVCSGEGDGLACCSTGDGGGGAGECWLVVNGCDLKGQGDGISEIVEAECGEVLEREPPAGDVDLVLRVGGVGIQPEFRSGGSAISVKTLAVNAPAGTVLELFGNVPPVPVIGDPISRGSTVTCVHLENVEAG